MSASSTSDETTLIEPAGSVAGDGRQPAPVVVEFCLLAQRRGMRDAVDLMLGSVLDLSVAAFDPDLDVCRRVRDLMQRYSDLPLEIGDATVVATAERLEQDTIATLDRRHFSVVKPLHVDFFTIVP
jgi:uncharacterized protein